MPAQQYGQRAIDNMGMPGRMLNDYLQLHLQYNRHVRDTYIFKRTKDKRRDWRGGQYPVVFEGGEASNYQSGGELVPEDKIQSESLVRGYVQDYKKIHSAYNFNAQDFIQHGNARVPQQSFLKFQLESKINKVRNRFQYLLTHSILNGGALVTGVPSNVSGVGAAVAANGRLRHIRVDRPDKVGLGERLMVVAGTNGAEECYVTGIDINSNRVSVATARNGNTGPQMTAALAANAAVNLFAPGDETESSRFSSLRSQILPASVSGGSDTIFGLNKTDYPFLQPIIRPLTGGITRAEDVLYDIIDLVTDYELKGQPIGAMDTYRGEKGDRTTKNQHMGITVDIVMSSRWFAVFQKYRKSLQNGNWPMDRNTFFKSATFMMEGPNGIMLRFVQVESLRDDVMYLLGDDCTQFATLNFIQQYISPDGNKWHTVRNPANGYSYICDFYVYGEFIIKRPAGTGALTGLNPALIDDFTVRQGPVQA